jgi:hypothetical protein
MKRFYKIFLGILVIGIVLGIIGSYMISIEESDVGTIFFMVGVLLIPISIVGIRNYYIKSDPVRLANFRRNQQLKREAREEERRRVDEQRRRDKQTYRDERVREKARQDEREERRRHDW